MTKFITILYANLNKITKYVLFKKKKKILVVARKYFSPYLTIKKF